ncbi:hypothetical protein ISU07_22945 [Nocardioides islandensis]|jgi:hypothetical protein|uniref:DUF6458 domain-containing protein n=1 Tax=Nocardioides islandensis TaxID=433663 RepID=A0A930YKF5_9ACTN|nr:DUF6458 family protein [Nocardioides islandensis]MBF4766004.1 hypothetical protein [Nocardioides islandensis]
MGYGLGVFLLAVGLIFALAVQDSIDAVNLTLVGWILAGCGALVIVLVALQANRTRGSATVATTTHADGTQTTTEKRTQTDPPPPPTA